MYKWENAIKDRWRDCDKALTLDECKALVQRVWSDYRPGDTPPSVRDGRGTRRAKGGRWDINLPVWARKMIVVLHEIGHSLQRHQPWHGPEFARLVLELWNHYADIPLGEAKSIGVHQKSRRVRFAPVGVVPRRPSKKWRIWKRGWESLHRELKEHKAVEPPKY